MSNDDINIEYFEIFPWNKNFETDIKIIDDQHKELVRILNKLAANLANLSDKLVLNEIFDELANYADYHFKTEEAIWSKYFKNDIWYEEHEKTHETFIGDVLALKENKDKKPFDDTIYEIVNFLSKWLAYHILDTDKRMSKVVLLLDKGLSIDDAKKQADLEMKGLMEVLVNTVLSMYESLSTRTLDLMREKALRVKAEKSLYLNEERWKLILEGGLENVWDIKIENDELFTDINTEYIINLFNEKIIKNYNDVEIHPLDIDRLKRDFKTHVRGESPFFTSKFRLLHKDKSWSWLLSRGKVVSKDKKIVRVVGTNSDITEREVASLIYKNSSQAMCITDFNNLIININPAFTEITGYTFEEVIGKNPNLLSSKMHSKDFYKHMWKKVNETGHFSGELTNRRKNGEVFSSILNINVVMNEDGLVDHYVGLFTDIDEKKKADEKIMEQANFDSLTNLYNRRIFQVELNEQIHKSNRTKIPFALFFIDLDHFKDVNDTLGHGFGDKILVETSKRIQNSIRESDILSRFGGDEFTLLLPDTSIESSIDKIASNIIEAITKPYIIGQEQIHISASIGITIYPNDGNNTTELLKNADQAMYEAKRKGRARYQYYLNEMQIEAKKNREIVSSLHTALDLKQFEIYYQPIINLKTGNIEKAEALLRWNKPNKGIVLPDEFISLAEKSGLIVKIGEWVYKETMNQNHTWRNKYKKDLQISINKSPIQFRVDVDIENWLDFMDSLGLSGKEISIEITENVLMESENSVKNKLLKFGSEGIEISIDDFGTGYSSLSYLKKFNVDYIKIDKSFVSSLEHGSKDVALCEAMIVMAHKLDIKVIAEGIEKEVQKDILSSMGCDYGQGYYFSYPLPASKFEEKYLKR